MNSPTKLGDEVVRLMKGALFAASGSSSPSQSTLFVTNLARNIVNEIEVLGTNATVHKPIDGAASDTMMKTITAN